MRKDREQQKNKNFEQIELFAEGEGKSSFRSTGGTESPGREEGELSSELEERRSLTVNSLERTLSHENLIRAYKQVVSNKGSSGVDNMDMDEFKNWYPKGITELRNLILKEEYQISPVLKVEIPKPSGGKRMLGIPTIKDRLIQQAIHQELSLYYEPTFSENSNGFRPGRNAQQAIKQASEYVSEGKEWVVDIDLEKFFDKVNHDRLMQRLSKSIGDKRLLRLIKEYLQAGMMTGGLVEQRIAGTPQGSPLSPLLSNIVLDELDKELERRGHSFCRYADDCNIYVKSQKAGERVMSGIIKFIEKKLKLKVNRQKSGVRRCSKVKFLGYTILEGGGIRVADKSIERLKDKIRELTRRTRGVKFEDIITELNRVIVGWSNYFSLANKWLAEIRTIDGWMRRKLRCYRLKQCGRKYTIVKLLSSLGAPLNQSWNVVNYTNGWWAMTIKPAVSHSMGKKWFANKGLKSFHERIQLKS